MKLTMADILQVQQVRRSACSVAARADSFRSHRVWAFDSADDHPRLVDSFQVHEEVRLSGFEGLLDVKETCAFLA
jgi:hypothetical protein